MLINEPDAKGDAPLHLATKVLDYGIVKVLMQNGVYLRVTNKEGLTALDMSKIDMESIFKQVNFFLFLVALMCVLFSFNITSLSFFFLGTRSIQSRNFNG